MTPTERIKALEKRVKALTERVEALEGAGTLTVEADGGLLRIVGDGFGSGPYAHLRKSEVSNEPT